MAHRVAPQAESDLDDIWVFSAQETSSFELASRLIEPITHRFLLLAKYPYIGRARDEVFGVGSRTFPVGEYVILYTVEGEDVFILRVAHSRRDIEELFGH